MRESSSVERARPCACMWDNVNSFMKHAHAFRPSINPLLNMYTYTLPYTSIHLPPPCDRTRQTMWPS